MTHPSTGPTASALCDRNAAARRRGESTASLWQRLVLAALEGRTIAQAAEVLAVHHRTCSRWVEHLLEHGVELPPSPGVPRGPGARGGKSATTAWRVARVARVS